MKQANIPMNPTNINVGVSWPEHNKASKFEVQYYPGQRGPARGCIWSIVRLLWSREENIPPRLEALDLLLPLLLESSQNLESPVHTEHQTGGQGMDIPSLETLRLSWCYMVTYLEFITMSLEWMAAGDIILNLGGANGGGVVRGNECSGYDKVKSNRI